MSTISQQNLASGLTTTSTPTAAAPTIVAGAVQARAVDVRDQSATALWIIGSSTGTLTVQVTNDPQGLVGWTNAAYREPGIGAYITTAITLAAATGRSIFLDPTDNIQWVRLAVTANAGTINAKCMGER